MDAGIPSKACLPVKKYFWLARLSLFPSLSLSTTLSFPTSHITDNVADMLVTITVLLLSASPFGDALGISLRQAKRADIVDRLTFPRLRPRASPPVCASSKPTV